jgi:hypothetical protein
MLFDGLAAGWVVGLFAGWVDGLADPLPAAPPE